MDHKYQQGDLTDIVRATGSLSGEPDWQFPTEPPATAMAMDMDIFQEPICRLDGFGNPFCNMRDPLLHNMSSSSSFFSSQQQLITTIATGPLARDAPATPTGRFAPAGGASSVNNILGSKIYDDDQTKRPCTSRFSQMLQISTGGGASPKLAAPPPVPAGIKTDSSMINANSSDSSGQISSPRNPGIKRRKSQAKKVVCIPAPACANSRPTGEVVPSDLWAWRKYGQKPIKGSPYPRGYYRCSSSKGCSARKQVERSRTDPNMLVISYTSEHNHPWPTQRNALAGSTRSQPSKASSASKSSPPSSQLHKIDHAAKEKESSSKVNNDDDANIEISVKEEIEKQLDMDDDGDDPTDLHHHQQHHHFSDGYQLCEGLSYKPAMPDSSSSNPEDSFFADLGEIEADPLHLLFTQGFSTTQQKDQTKGLDDQDQHQFTLFDWSQDSNKGL